MLGDQVLAYVEKLEGLDDVEAVTDCLLEEARPFGFGSLAYGDLGVGNAPADAFFSTAGQKRFSMPISTRASVNPIS